MRAVIQRVQEASVVVEGHLCSRIGPGFLVLLGISKDDTMSEVLWLVQKIVHLRLFSDEKGSLQFSVQDLDLELLVVSQFTLYGNCLRGRRPDFLEAARPEHAEHLYEEFIQKASLHLKKPIQTGRFGEKMSVSLINDGPITIILDTKDR